MAAELQIQTAPDVSKLVTKRVNRLRPGKVERHEFRAVVTPYEQRPYRADVVRWACTEVIPGMLPQVDYLETMQQLYDKSEGQDKCVGREVELVSSIIWRAIFQKTGPTAVYAEYRPHITPDLETQMPDPHSPAAYGY